ncbi:hypothetical protein [Streptomyces sp. NBC_00893]|uniref:hypothetical protein n=1 Tax=Streptomyces sp. NBC_00893 TaxID=2975862 RepID=UPI002251C805|nr:hypothetical protein [Streptomyces sp. NBC_00893]MCX4848333.1 hypothetical protein [Streptomyces sp. NBC_00893]
MGIRTDAFIAPPKPVLLRPEAFGSLVVGLARERVVRTPWAVLAGKLCVNAGLNWGSVSGQARWEEAGLLASGDAILDVLPTPRAAPYGVEGFASVVSRCFGPDMISGETWG